MLQFVANEDTLQGLVFWTMGSIDRASWQKVGILFAVLAVVMPLSMLNAWKLTALRLGEDRAMSFGINVRRLRLTTLLRISILSALSVAFVGQSALLASSHRTLRAWFLVRITAFICPPAPLLARWCYRSPRWRRRICCPARSSR